MKRKAAKTKRVSKTAKKKRKPKPVFIRELQVRFKKRRVKATSKTAKPITDRQQIVDLFRDLENETKEKFVSLIQR